MVNKKRAYGVFTAICTALIINFWLGAFVANASTAMKISDAAVQQTRPVSTFREDSRLTNSCIESGQDKSYCVCLTSIYKHRLDVRDYKAAVTLFEAEKNPDPSAIETAHARLTAQSYKSEEISTIEAARRDLTNETSFNKLCQDAITFFAAD